VVPRSRVKYHNNDIQQLPPTIEGRLNAQQNFAAPTLTTREACSYILANGNESKRK
jgi:hypothetical protein